MKNIIIIIVILIFSACQNVNNEDNHSNHLINESENSKSPHKVSMDYIGNTHVHIAYNAPSIRNRIIWGGLVPLEEVWVTGAHQATSIHFYQDVLIDNQNVPAGKYGFFSIPGKDSWTLILNENWDQHLTDDYDPALDLLRWKVVPEKSDLIERLTFNVNPQDSTVSVSWEKLKVSFKINPIDE